MQNKQQIYIILVIFLLLVTLTYQNNNIPISYVKITLNQSILKSSIHYNCHNLSPFFLAKSQILKILHKKNICHKSSDEKPALYLCC
jgi:hypothetical protein